MPADSLTTGCANRHVGHPLIFIELLSEQLLQTSRRYNSSENPTVTPSCRLETCSTRHRRIFRSPPPPRQTYLGYYGREHVLV